MINVLVMSPCDEHDKKILENAGSGISFTYSSKSSSSLKEEIAQSEIIVGEPEIEMIYLIYATSFINTGIFKKTVFGRTLVQKLIFLVNGFL